MITEVRKWSEKNGTFRQLLFEKAMFYGPSIMVIENTPDEGYGILQPESSSYKVEDSEEAIGVNNILIAFAKEYFLTNNTPFYLKSKLGIIFVNSLEVEKIFEEFAKKIILF